MRKSDISLGFLHANFQNQPPRVVLSKRCSENMQKIYRRTRMPKSDFKNVAQQQLGLETRIFNGLKLQLFWYHSQNIIKPISCHWCLLIPPKNIPLVFWCFQRVSKEITGMKWVKVWNFLNLSWGWPNSCRGQESHVVYCRTFTKWIIYLKLQALVI